MTLPRRIRVATEERGAAVRSISGGQRQAVAIACAVACGSGLVVIDEPTAALGLDERT
ncbi:ATP-binding cassette domain-containing protein [Streptomyces sp. NPDC006355]|uniref:ATP-binding cassette domain-containing protein n=1 Tax=Streptomyces sp. NPDC006355 TaxID=3156758 RepID=UPI0033A98192